MPQNAALCGNGLIHAVYFAERSCTKAGGKFQLFGLDFQTNCICLVDQVLLQLRLFQLEL